MASIGVPLVCVWGGGAVSTCRASGEMMRELSTHLSGSTGVITG
jgi:hypothetical protein